ncbi:hypothetical protein BpHYR1_011921 [Brachionus plicatilis]|uniref:Secreted protein n=1 Tax=Brachionus plicatilis TaxID=10195 RepID=A0A3M7R2Q0_BRAPC|nr:hypothetical protein BpHYR1_011921 [Brachionus plicatilis]
MLASGRLVWLVRLFCLIRYGWYDTAPFIVRFGAADVGSLHSCQMTSRPESNSSKFKFEKYCNIVQHTICTYFPKLIIHIKTNFQLILDDFFKLTLNMDIDSNYRHINLKIEHITINYS